MGRASTPTHFQAMRAQAAADKIPVISPQNAEFLAHILLQRRPLNVLEIGSAIGVSGAIIARTLQAWGGQLTTVEISVPTQAKAQNNFSRLGLSNVCSLCGDARVLMAQWAQQAQSPFDCVFIDAQKSQTQVFYEAALGCVAANGAIIVDDAWKYRHKMQAFYQSLAARKQAYSLHFVDTHDATMLIQVP